MLWVLKRTVSDNEQPKLMLKLMDKNIFTTSSSFFFVHFISIYTCTSIIYCRGTRKRRERLLEETDEEVGVVNPSMVRHTL